MAANAERTIEPEIKNSVCQCVNGLLPALKPEYAGLLERVDMHGDSVNAVAAEIGITLNNATVRLHRARRALKERLERCCGSCATQGCSDCTCKISHRL
jgi:RNA polymerase sigma-70 factor (ECF subfamily)